MRDTGQRGRTEAIALYLALACPVAALVSIAASQLLLAVAVVALLFSRLRLRLPPIWLPLAVFIAGTLVSLAVSEQPVAGLPQLRKLFAFFVLLAVFSVLETLAQARRLVLAWAVVAAASTVVGLAQFAAKLSEARRLGVSFYEHYVSERISGFMSHWMTFGGQLMLVGLVVLAWWIFGPHGRWSRWLLPLCGCLIGAGLLLNMTRSIWLAAGAGAIYLIWSWQPRWLVLLPVTFALFLWLSPDPVRTRLASIYRPKKEVDSNMHRVVCWRTGWRMIRAHPWFGLGPEMVRLRFMDYLPADAPQPLPTGWYGHLHNTYLHYAAERGIPTALALVWLLAQAFWELASAARRLPRLAGDARFLLYGAAAAVLGIAVSGLFEVNLGDSEVLMLFLAILACGYFARGRVGAEAADA